MGKISDLLKTELWQDPDYEIHQVKCPQFAIEAIDPELYAKLLAEGTAAGAKFDGTKASISGCDFDWDYDPASQTLNITCTRKPFYAGCELVEEKLRQLVAAAKGAL